MTVTVPFLIAKDVLDVPDVGVNVIEEITKHFDRGSSARVNGLGVANGKCENFRDHETSVFLCEPETFCLFRLRDQDFKVY